MKNNNRIEIRILMNTKDENSDIMSCIIYINNEVTNLITVTPETKISDIEGVIKYELAMKGIKEILGEIYGDNWKKGE